jgi:hypothetical protein
VVLTGAVGLIGLFFTWHNLKQTREHTDKQLEQAREGQIQTQESTLKTLELTEQGQLTERFTRAIEQLGATNDEGKKKLEIRLGGIYALERIDKESPERAYHGTVVEVLTAYVRENAPWRPNASEPTPRTPPADIQAIVDVLRRREEDRVPSEHRVQFLDLRRTDLRDSRKPPSVHTALREPTLRGLT